VPADSVWNVFCYFRMCSLTREAFPCRLQQADSLFPLSRKLTNARFLSLCLCFDDHRETERERTPSGDSLGRGGMGE